MTAIYLISDNEELIEMREQAYDSEDLLQGLLERYPSVLAGDEINPSAPRRWLLVAREMGLPSAEGGSDRWSVDHLFLDQDGIPTVVEVKRSEDTRIRREVVGQMLDYAANGVVYWPIERLQATFEARHEGAGELVAQLVADDTISYEDFWQRVRTNLQAGHIRLVFVADRIPAELRRIVEFLNGQMKLAEVLAIEVKQFVSESGLKSLVPKVLGMTAAAEQAKRIGGNLRRWDESSFFAELEARKGLEIVGVARHILEHAKKTWPGVNWGGGPKEGSCAPHMYVNGAFSYLFSMYTYGRVEIVFQYMKQFPMPFLGSEENREELLRRLNEIPAVNIDDAYLDKRPSIPLAVLSNEEALRRFLEVSAWAAEGFRSVASDAS